MKVSIFSRVWDYFLSFLRSSRATFDSLFTVFPYLFGIGEQRKEITEQYPDPISSRTADDLPPRSRGLLFNDIDRCTGCGTCVTSCPTRAIFLKTDIGPDSQAWVAQFDIDFAKCIFCGLCVENCQPQSLSHTRQFEGAVFEISELTASFGRGFVTPEQREKWAKMRKQNESEGIGL